MKLPKRLDKAVKTRQEFIDNARAKLEKTVVKSQSKFLEEILTDLIDGLKFDEYGNIRDISSNYRKIADFEKIFTSWNNITATVISGQIITNTFGLVELGRNYFGLALIKNLPERFDKVIAQTSAKMNLRIGIDGGKMVRGGFLDSFLKDNTISTQVKNYISKSVTGQVNRKEFISGLGKMINGDEGPGTMEKQYQRFTYDLYQQYDAAYNASLADEFDMNFFDYQGGLINDSRDFCAAHNNKIWSRDEAQLWPEWTPSKGDFPEGYEIKQKDIYSVPSYISYPGYQPLIDRGGYNCRHILAFVSDELAFEMRPELNIVNK